MRRALAVSVVALALLAVAAPARASNDPMFGRQYGPQQIGAPAAWTKTRGAGVTIAIVDSGVDVDHPDLKAKLLPGRDFADNDANPDDDSQLKDGNGVVVQGHGTHVAGIASAITDNGVGVAGVAPDAKLLPLKVFSSKSTASLLDAVTAIPNAIRYAVDNGAKVINLSVGTFQGLSLVGVLETPCADAFSRGSLCVVAAGNDGADKPSGYARGFQALVVTANDKDGKHAGFGQKADTQWALSAPGVANWSTVPVELGSYGEKQGTSMAAPHAAGVAALLFAQGLNNQAVLDRMLSTARGMGDPGTNGAGRVDAAAATGASAPAPTATAAAAGGSTATTRRSGAVAPASGASGGGTASAGRSTATTALDDVAVVPDDELAFSGGPAAANRVQGGIAPKQAKEVSTWLIVVTLAVIAAFGIVWGGFAVRGRRGEAEPELASAARD